MSYVNNPTMTRDLPAYIALHRQRENVQVGIPYAARQIREVLLFYLHINKVHENLVKAILLHAVISANKGMYAALRQAFNECNDDTEKARIVARLALIADETEEAVALMEGLQ